MGIFAFMLAVLFTNHRLIECWCWLPYGIVVPTSRVRILFQAFNSCICKQTPYLIKYSYQAPVIYEHLHHLMLELHICLIVQACGWGDWSALCTFLPHLQSRHESFNYDCKAAETAALTRAQALL